MDSVLIASAIQTKRAELVSLRFAKTGIFGCLLDERGEWPVEEGESVKHFSTLPDGLYRWCFLSGTHRERIQNWVSLS